MLSSTPEVLMPDSDSAPRRRPAARPRRGLALLTAILALVVIAVLIVGGFFAGSQEFRGGRNLLIEQRAFAIAEYGLNFETSNWDRGRNLPPPAGMAIGGIDSTRRYIADGDTAFVRITRLNNNTFWVISEGRAHIGMNQLESARRTNAAVRIAYPSIKAKGALTTAGNVKITGASKISGFDTTPTGWLIDCLGLTKSDTVPGVTVAPGKTVDYKASNILSTPKTYTDPQAADSNTYVRYGSETWNSLATNADIKLSGGTMGTDILPVGTDTTCVASNTNWGEPARPGTVKGCRNHYPIIYSATSLKLNGKGRGQGILLVNGDFEINGQFDFYGIVIARDNVTKGNGTARIFGTVFARDAEVGDESFIAGTQDIYYSSCAIERALRASAVLTRVKERHWTQLF